MNRRSFFCAALAALALLAGCGSRPEASASSEPSDQPVFQPLPPVLSESVSAGLSSEEASSQSAPELEPGDWRLLLVNPQNPIAEDFAVELAPTLLGYQVDARIVKPFEQMVSAAQLDGIELMPCYGYRTFEQSAQLFEKQINRQMAAGLTREQAELEAKRWVAPPGYSEHHTGLALDIVTPSNQVLTAAFAETDAAKWMAQNAHRFGFILRYPQDKQEITGIVFEPWHFRYVGEEHAAAIFESGLCLEEYLKQLLQE